MIYLYVNLVYYNWFCSHNPREFTKLNFHVINLVQTRNDALQINSYIRKQYLHGVRSSHARVATCFYSHNECFLLIKKCTFVNDFIMTNIYLYPISHFPFKPILAHLSLFQRISGPFNPIPEDFRTTYTSYSNKI